MEEWAFETTFGGTLRDYQRDAFPPFPAKNLRALGLGLGPSKPYRRVGYLKNPKPQTQNPKTLNPKTLNPKTQNPKTQNPKPQTHKPQTAQIPG